MKNLWSDFRSTNPGSNFDYRDFYEFYFANTSLELDISLENFYDPSNIEKPLKENKTLLNKTINNGYLKTIFKSTLFKEAFIKRFNKLKITEDYPRKLAKKIEKLLLWWDR